MLNTDAVLGKEKSFQTNESKAQRLLDSAPQFASKADAIVFYTQELEQLAAARSLKVNSLLEMATNSRENHEDFDRALRLSSLIFALKK